MHMHTLRHARNSVFDPRVLGQRGIKARLYGREKIMCFPYLFFWQMVTLLYYAEVHSLTTYSY